MMLKAFQSFDDVKSGLVATFKISSMLKSMNLLFDKDQLAKSIENYDPESKIILLLAITLNFIISTIDSETGVINFDTFVAIASDFFDDEDEETMQQELRQAFRLYVDLDKDGRPRVLSINKVLTIERPEQYVITSIAGVGYITTKTLRDILTQLDDKLTASDLVI